ncbi:PREDICTED: uncharacterized protein LOC107358583 [Acropora digitifera]|uniref:uncharacterized protein LOC107358583 n=1 Tax=Acropora digitifera TaxID=70779 RepID=UPI00077AFF73|nr:PREDICTED: uncharacterized protein LOC107358583 [Acropora digitifera]
MFGSHAFYFVQCFVFSILYNSYFRRLVIMAQYHLRSLPSRDYAAMHAGDELNENEEFHDSFDFPQETAPPGISSENPDDDIDKLTAAIAQAQAENDELERRAEVTKLKAELHALRKRNAHLQSQTARVEALSTVPTGRVAAREPSVTINQLRADPVLTERVSAEIDRLGLSSSDSEDEGVASNTKKHSRGKKLRSGKTAKLTSRVIVPRLWPHNYLSLAYVSKDRNYDELTLAEFAAGYASILQLKTLPLDERTARLDHFVVLMYLVTQFAWPAVGEFHAAVLFEIECGRARWGDSFAHLESRLLRATGKPVSNTSPLRQSNAVLFCRDFQTGKCTHTKDHYGMIRNERKWLQHICAKCWTSSRTIARHTEFSDNCPGLSASTLRAPLELPTSTSA